MSLEPRRGKEEVKQLCLLGQKEEMTSVLRPLLPDVDATSRMLEWEMDLLVGERFFGCLRVEKFGPWVSVSLSASFL